MSTTGKVQLHLISTQQVVQVKEGSKVNLLPTSTFCKVMELLKKKLAAAPGQTVFLYYKEFAIYPDTLVGDIVQHSPGLPQYDIYYSLSEAYG